VSRDYPPDPEMQNPRRVDRHPQARAEQRRLNEEALSSFINTKNLQIRNTNSEGAAETAMSAALRKAVRRKAVRA
jgi:hypothetical protein